MRRTLALFGATALAITGLAGPANADIGVTQLDVVFGTVQPDTTTMAGDQALYELVNQDMVASAELEDHFVEGCLNDDTNVTHFATYGELDEIGPDGSFITSDPNYIGTKDITWGAPSGVFDTDVYRIQFVDPLGSVIDFDEKNAESLSETCLGELS